MGYRTPVFIQRFPWRLHITITYNLRASTTMICWRCHSNSVNTGSRLPICSDIKTRKRQNMVGIDMIRNNSIEYMVIQCVLGFLIDDCVLMDTYMSRDPCENDMFTNSNKVFFYQFQLFLKWKGFEFCNSQLPTSKKENPNRSWMYSHQKRQRT